MYCGKQFVAYVLQQSTYPTFEFGPRKLGGYRLTVDLPRVQIIAKSVDGNLAARQRMQAAIKMQPGERPDSTHTSDYGFVRLARLLSEAANRPEHIKVSTLA